MSRKSLPRLFDEELAYFEEHREEFVKEALRKFVLIKGKKHYGFFDSDDKAYEKGVEIFGLEPFLIKEVLPEDVIYDIPALRLGLIDATL